MSRRTPTWLMRHTDPVAYERIEQQRRSWDAAGPPPANSPLRDREGELCEAAYRCESCDRPWIVFAVHGEPTDGVDDPRKCRFCEDGIGRRIR